MSKLRNGQVVDGRYEIITLLQETPTASVYLARHLPLQRLVAMKVVHLGARESLRAERFDLRVRATARIRSKHVAELCDAGELPGGDRYLVLEYLRGETVESRFQRLGRMTPTDSFALGVQVAKGLAAAHHAGIVHRDVKPVNLFLMPRPDGSEWLKILDFGVAKGVASAVTPIGVVRGTPLYLAPELALGSRKADPRTDVYSLGAVLYYLLTGEAPYPARNVPELIWVLRNQPLRPLRSLRPDLTADVELIVHKALALAVEDRYPTAAAFAKTLAAWLGLGADREPATQRLPSEHTTRIGSETELDIELEWSHDDEQTTVRMTPPRALVKTQLLGTMS